MSTVLSILNAIERGEPNAAEQLLPMVYTELRNWLPASSLRNLQATRFSQLLWCTRHIYGS